MNIWLLTSEAGLARLTPRALLEAGPRFGASIRPVLPERCVCTLTAGHLLVFERGSALALPDVVLNWRSSTGDHLTFTLSRHLEAAGIPVLNPTEALLLGRDKGATLQKVAAAGLPVPWSATAPPSDAPDVELPVVVKTMVGGSGAGVFLCRTRAELSATLAELAARPDEAVLFQAFVRTDPVFDLKVCVVGGEVVGGIRRVAPSGDWKANMATGARAERWTPEPEARSLAVAACEALGLAFAGVDLFWTPEGLLFNEANPAPQYAEGGDAAPWTSEMSARIFELAKRHHGSWPR